jgi:hypothetical protein
MAFAVLDRTKDTPVNGLREVMDGNPGFATYGRIDFGRKN